MEQPEIGPDTPKLHRRFALIRRLGDAGTTLTAAAWDDTDRAWRVAKVLVGGRHDVAPRFRAKIAAARSVKHPALPEVRHDGDDEGGRPFAVVDLVGGPSLLDLVLSNGEVPARQAVSVVADALDGLAAAHRAGLVHGGIGPSHVRISDGRGRLVGLVSARDGLCTVEPHDLSALGLVAPEVVLGKVATPAADVYAMAASLWQAITGTDAVEIFRQGQAVSAALPEPLRASIASALAPDPADRPDAAGFAAALRSSSASLPEAPPVDAEVDRSAEPGPWPELGMRPVGEQTVAPPPSQVAAKTPVPVAPSTPPVAEPAPPPVAPAKAATPAPAPAKALPVEEPEPVSSGVLGGLGGALLALLAATSVVVLAFVVVGAIVLGATSVGSAEAEHAAAVVLLLERVDQEKVIAADLRSIGLDVEPLAMAEKALSLAESQDEKEDAARTYVETAARLVSKVPTATERHSAELVKQRIDGLRHAGDEAENTRRRWRNAASTPHGGIAVSIGLATGP